jgi:hypothetical protein
MADAPQVAYDSSPAIAYEKRKQNVTGQEAYGYRNVSHPPESAPARPLLAGHQPRTIFGLRRRNFWTLFAAVLIIVGATVGGSIGGSLAVRSTKYTTHHADNAATLSIY